MKIIRNFKKALIITLVFLVALSSGFYNAGSAKASQLNVDQFRKHGKSVKLQDSLNKKYKDSDVVRVIVELDGKPAISYATQQGVRYKDLSKSKRADLQAKVDSEQSTFLSRLKSNKIQLSVENKFTTVSNGISGKIKYGNINQLKRLQGVSNVYIANEYKRPVEKPDMITSKGQVQAQQTWNLGLKGEGMVVGIIDTGIDYTHHDMVLSSNTEGKLTQSTVNDLVSKEGLPGKYFTSKVPYGYNYADRNKDIIDKGTGASMHGMHVAGIVGANGDESNGGVQGVAPEAQLLAMKVFSNDQGNPSTYGDIYIKAIDDAIKLEADVINMSLGSPASFVAPDDPEQQAVQNAVDNGVLMSISAGNSAYFGSGYANPLAWNPDIGMVGAPSVADASISVASVENTDIQMDQIEYDIEGTKGTAGYMSASSTNPNDLNQRIFDIAYGGKGNPAELGNKVKGKYALIQRGDLNFVDKAINAQKAGAVGVIIYNTAPGFINMASDPSITIPQLFLQQSDGEKLQQALADGKPVQITFKDEKIQLANANAGKMSDFSSWGITPSLDFKPEITAPGGQIYSTFNNNTYGLMSGTSMAAPHVSGGSALVLEAIQKKFPNLQGADKVKRAKTLLMNTSSPIIDPDGTTYYSPRQQGAGIMQLASAVETPVYVTQTGTNEGKIALKEIKTDKFTMSVTATNFGKDEVTYNVGAKVLTDALAKNEVQFAMQDQEIKNAHVTFNKDTVTLKPGESKEITATVDLTAANGALKDLMPNGYYVEGFITLTSTEKVPVPNLSVPFVGFKGDWNAADILDGMIYDDDSFYGYSGMVDEAGNYLGDNPVTWDDDENKIAFSPNGDGNSDTIAPILSFLRNSKTVEYSIVDKDGKQLRKLHTDSDVYKDYFDASRGEESMFTYNPSLTSWDGKINNKQVADGTYYYQIKTQIDYPGKAPQVKKIPVIVDTKSPEFQSISYNKGTNKVSFTAADVDNGSGINYFAIAVNGKLDGYAAGSDKTSSYEYTIKHKVPDGSTIAVIAFDYAGNSAVKLYGEKGDYHGPDIMVTSPENLFNAAYNERTVDFAGYVTNAFDIKGLVIKGDAIKGSVVNVPLQWDNNEQAYYFDTPITFTKDGVHDINVTWTDGQGEHDGFTRQVIIDSTAPTIAVKGLPANNYVSDSTNSIKLTATVGDNFDQMIFKVNGSEEYTHDVDSQLNMVPLSHDVKLTIPLEHGKNEIEFTAEDLGGNVTTKTVTIFKGVQLDKPMVNPVGDNDTKVTGSAVAGATVSVKANSKEIGKGTADKNGKFSVSIAKQKAGTSLEVTASKEGLYSQVVTVKVLDKTPPAAPKVNKVSDKDKKVTGTAEAGSTVTVYAGKTKLGSAKANSKGAYSVTIKAQKGGTSLSVTATDKAGNVSKATVVKVAGTTPPVAPKVNKITTKTTKVKGTAKAGTKITVYAGKKKLGTGKADKKGAFSVTIKKQKAGTTLSVTATDAAGKVSKATKVKVSQAAPSTPTVNTVKSSSKTVKGKGEVGSKVYVKAGSKVLGSAKVDKKGNYSVKIKKQKAGTKLTVYATKSGKKSASKTVKVKK